ncbi:hypothetical protein HY642_00870 [Candidatus Woesearchaeota archaeon]|nr:hypothetical protein [Candidatus Woesearchaeota archaeon]
MSAANSRKSQMEILGLAIIVVLVIMGVLFTLIFVVKQPADKTATEVKTGVLGSSWTTTLLGTTTECNKLTVEELLVDCSRNPDNPRVKNCPGGDKSCAYVSSFITDIHSKTLEVWRPGKTYVFIDPDGDATNPTGYEIEINAACIGEVDPYDYTIPLGSGYGDRTVHVEICA